MGIGSIQSTNNISVMQVTTSDLKDYKTRNIQDEITDTQQKIQKLASTEDLSVHEKTNERKKLQKEISSLNTELKQHQEELLKSHKREIMLTRLQEEIEPTKEEESESKVQEAKTSSDTDSPENQPADKQQTAQPGTVITQSSDGTVILKEILKQADEIKEETPAQKETTPTDDEVIDGSLSGNEMHAMVSADSFLKQAGHQGTLVAKTSDGIAILKSEIKQDERRGVDTERKQAELEKMQKQKQREMAFQFSRLEEANDAMKPVSETNGSVKNNPRTDTENTFYISGLHVPQEEQTAQQRFYVSFG